LTGNGGQHILLSPIVAGKSRNLAALVKSDNCIRKAKRFGQIACGDKDAAAAVGEVSEMFIDLGSRADVDARGRVQEDEEPALFCEPPAERELLLR
jgi:hypothetical protein